MKKLFYLCILFAIVVCYTACGNKNKSESNEEMSVVDQIVENDSRYDKFMLRSKDDSTKIVELATQYLNLLKENKIDEAISMLHEIDDSANVKPLSDSFMSTLKKQLNRFPVLSYTIDDFQIFSAQHTDLHYTYEFMHKPEGSDIPNTLKGVLSPCRVNGEWYLTISPDLVDTKMNDIENSKYN